MKPAACRLALCALVFAYPLAVLAQSETRALVLEESASITPPTSGTPGLVMFKATAEYDDFLAYQP